MASHFPVMLADQNVSAQNPDSNIDWSQFLPITGVPGYCTTNRIPYAEEYTLSSRAAGRRQHTGQRQLRRHASPSLLVLQEAQSR